MEKYFFEIPVYRCSPKQYQNETEQLYNKIAAEFEPFRELLPGTEIEPNIQHRFIRLYHGYEYNETVGWIRLYVFGDQIRGRYYFETNPRDRERIKNRLNKGLRKKRFEDFEKAFELTLYRDMSSEQIFKALLEELARINKKERPFKKRYLDLESLKNIGQFVNWHDVMRELNFFNN